VKRFWDDVTIRLDDDGHAILLDGKPMHLPGGGILRVGPAPLAGAIADEWRLAGGAKGGEMSFADTAASPPIPTPRSTPSPAMARATCSATAPNTRWN
jgi:ATP12 chaperone protein